VIHDLKPYPEYRDTGVPWLGKVPTHWKVRRLKTIASMKSGESITELSIEKAGFYPVYGGNGIRGYNPKYTHDGDYILVGRQGALCGNVHVVRGKFWASEHAVVAAPVGDYNVAWYASLLRAMNLNQYSVAAAQPGLAVERIQNLWAPVPTPTEQFAISRFLNYADRSIRRYTRAKQKLIALLNEQKQVIVHRAVTRGLDPEVRLKPSGMDWLGRYRNTGLFFATGNCSASAMRPDSPSFRSLRSRCGQASASATSSSRLANR
jgi:type I restriction enzyme, S subunit